jgi:hypothetical protein
MSRVSFPVWLRWTVWATLHVAIALISVTFFVDPFTDLISPMDLSEVCEDYIKMRVDWGALSTVLFAARCWDARQALPFCVAALVAVGVILSPFTFAMIAAQRRRLVNPLIDHRD